MSKRRNLKNGNSNVVKSEIMSDNKNTDNIERKIDDLVSKFVENEKQAEINPFFASVVMSKIAHLEKPVNTNYKRIFQPVAFAASVIVAIFMGISIGNFYFSTQKLHTEAISINDVYIEHLDVITSELD